MALTTLDIDSSLSILSIPTIDIRLLSQTELYSLSLSSHKPLLKPHRTCEEIPIPKIDRSVFNESAGSRKQTYSRLRLAPPSARPRFTRKPYQTEDPPQDTQIVSLFNQLFANAMNSDVGKSIVVVHPNFENSGVVSKRKRGRPRKDETTSTPVESGNDVGKALVVCQDTNDVMSSGKRKRGRPNKDSNSVVVSVAAADDVNNIPVSENVEVKDGGIMNPEAGGADVIKGIAFPESAGTDEKIGDVKGVGLDIGTSTGKRKRGRPKKGDNLTVPLVVKVAGGEDVTENVVSHGITENGVAGVDDVMDNVVSDVKVDGGDDVTDNVVRDGITANGLTGDHLMTEVTVADKLNVTNTGVASGKVEIVSTVGSVGKKKRGRPRKDQNIQDIGDRGRVIANGKGVAEYMVGGVGKDVGGGPMTPGAVKPVDGDDVYAGAVVDTGSSVSKKRRGAYKKDVFWNSPQAACGASNITDEAVVFGNVQDREIVNKNGIDVDFAALACLDDPYATELKRRTDGLTTKKELLDYLGAMEGKWRSEQKRIVEANTWGDVLPSGWKLMLAPKVQKGKASLHCRCYISPSGRQFVSCKEVSEYLLSLSVLRSTTQRIYSHSNEGIQVTHPIKLANSSDGFNAPELAAVEDHTKENLCQSSSAIASISGNHRFDHDLNVLPCDKQDLQVNIDEETFAAQSCDKQNSVILTSNDNVGGVNEAKNTVAADTNLCLVSESVVPSDGLVGNSGNEIMLGFGSAHGQPDVDVLGEDTAVHIGDMVSDKAEDALSRVGKMFNSRPTPFEGLRRGRTEDSSSRQPVSNILPTQDFDSSFGLGRNALMASVGVGTTSQATSPEVCMWCSNEFHQDAAQSFTNTNMCPTCNERFSATG